MGLLNVKLEPPKGPRLPRADAICRRKLCLSHVQRTWEQVLARAGGVTSSYPTESDCAELTVSAQEKGRVLQM